MQRKITQPSTTTMTKRELFNCIFCLKKKNKKKIKPCSILKDLLPSYSIRLYNNIANTKTTMRVYILY